MLTLLTVSGMVGRSFLSAMQSKPGLDAKGVVTFQVSLPGSQRAALPAISDLARQIAAVPGTKSVTFAAELPVGSPAFSTVTAARGGDLRSTDPMIAYRLIGPAYFETLGAHFATGRTFPEQDVQQSRPVVLMNQAAERLLFPGETAIGRKVSSGIGERKSVVVGVVKDIRAEGLDRAAAPMVYMPCFPQFGLRFIVRTSVPPGTLLPILRAQVRGGNPGVLLQRFQPLADILDETVRDRKVSGVLVGGFALLGLIVSSVGLYGTLAAQVQQRRREIGVRMALGATVRSVATIVLGEGLRIVLLGALAGVWIRGRRTPDSAGIVRRQFLGFDFFCGGAGALGERGDGCMSDPRLPGSAPGPGSGAERSVGGRLTRAVRRTPHASSRRTPKRALVID